MTQADELRALIEKATQSDLADDGRYFSESCNDLTSCRHGETGEYNDSDDGKLVEFLWNNRHDYLARLAHQTPPATQPSATVGEVERLQAMSDRATPGPWAWEQCGEKEDVPVVGIAFPGDDPDCKAPYEGEFRDSDAYRVTIAYDWQSCDGCSASSNAAFAVACVNYVRELLATLHTPPPVATATVVDAAKARLMSAASKARNPDNPDQAVTVNVGDLALLLAATPTPPAGDR